MCRLELSACVSPAAVSTPPSIGQQQKCTERGQDYNGTWSFSVFSQFGRICFKACFEKWGEFQGELTAATEDSDIHESCFTNPSRQSHKACHNLPLSALSLFSLNIALCPFGIYYHFGRINYT